MNWVFDGNEWRAKGSYNEFRVSQSKNPPGFRAEAVGTDRRRTLATEHAAKEWCEDEDRRMRM